MNKRQSWKNKKIKEYHMIANSVLSEFNQSIQVHLDNDWKLSGKTTITAIIGDNRYKPTFVYHQLVVR